MLIRWTDGITANRPLAEITASNSTASTWAADINGIADLAIHRIEVGAELVGKKVVLWLDGHLVHVVHDGVLAIVRLPPQDIPQDQHGTLPRRQML
jgi:hypothetical protein